MWEKRKLEEHCCSMFNYVEIKVCIMIEMDDEQDTECSLEAQAETE